MADVTDLSAEEFTALREAESPVIEGVTFAFIREQDGIRTYRSTSGFFALALVEHEGKLYQIVFKLRVSERWICHNGDPGRSSRHVAVMAQRALGIR